MPPNSILHIDESSLERALRSPHFEAQVRRELSSPDANIQESGLVTRRFSDIPAKPVNWLWPGRVARGKVSILAGNPGLGKSQITASLAAVVTTGGQWPVDRTLANQGEVLIFSAEDDPGDTIRLRLEAAGANLRGVHFVDGVISGFSGSGARQQRCFSLESHLDALEAKLTELGGAVSLVVIDPITGYLGAVDSHKNAEVRGLIGPLSDLAARHGTAVIGVSHLNKTVGTQALMRVTGSLAFVAAARSAYLVAEDPKDKSRRLFLPLKNNIGPDQTGFAFRIEETTVINAAGSFPTSRVLWEQGTVTQTADEVLAANSRGTESSSALDDASDFLREELSGGPLTSNEIKRRAKSEGIAWTTLRRASALLGIKPTKSGMTAGWVWSLPKMLNESEDAHS